FRTILNSFTPPAVDQYQVPSVLGLTIEEAESAEQVKDVFTIEEKGSVFSTEYPEGVIAEQNPAPKETRKGNQLVIEVWTSLGEERGEMISVKGMTAAQARIKLSTLIEKYHLTIVDDEENYQFSDEVEENGVIDTIPAPGEEIREGDAVTLIVSKGPEIKYVPVPQFVGQKIDAVRSQLETFKLVCTDADVVTVESREPEGTILWQSLEASSQAEEGATIRFRISGGLAVEEMRVSFTLPDIEDPTVSVDIYVGDETTPQYSETVRVADGLVSPTLRGSGIQMVRVYFNGQYSEKQSHEVQFN
ncbi:MAG: PASTA domain-containing protein, partial [Oscillibacter sp.]|nr:PASTA domain-containing protein [Oscillibacter sp.]